MTVCQGLATLSVSTHDVSMMPRERRTPPWASVMALLAQLPTCELGWAVCGNQRDKLVCTGLDAETYQRSSSSGASQQLTLG